jgi:integrase
MASIQKTAKGYRAQISIKGIRDSKVFPTKREAVDWANRRELELRDDRPAGDTHSLRDAMRKYANEVSPHKRGERWEQVRLAAFEGYLLPMDKMMADITAADIALFRDSRSKAVGPSSVLRELTVLSSVFEAARREWGWIQGNPCRDIRKPASAKHRERTIAWWEIKRLLREMGYAKHKRVASTGHAVAVCFLVALRTGMRAGELCGLTWAHVHDDYCHLPTTKSGKSRDVPLSTKAQRLLAQIRGWDDKLVFGLKTASLDALFRKYRSRAGLSGFTWHDSRHTAATMMAKKLDVLTLCKVMGWADTRFALVYFNPKASSIAALLG